VVLFEKIRVGSLSDTISDLRGNNDELQRENAELVRDLGSARSETSAAQELAGELRLENQELGERLAASLSANIELEERIASGTTLTAEISVANIESGETIDDAIELVRRLRAEIAKSPAAP